MPTICYADVIAILPLFCFAVADRLHNIRHTNNAAGSSAITLYTPCQAPALLARALIFFFRYAIVLRWLLLRYARYCRFIFATPLPFHDADVANHHFSLLAMRERFLLRLMPLLPPAFAFKRVRFATRYFAIRLLLMAIC